MMIYYAVEDELSLRVAVRLIRECVIGAVDLLQLGRRQGGFGHIKANLPKYSALAKRESVFILTDLDRADCPPGLRAKWLAASGMQDLPPNLKFCVAVREVEAWLLADRDNLATFLTVNSAQIPADPEQNVLNPKEHLVAIARHAKDRSVRDDLLPLANSPAGVGIGYNHRLSQFVNEAWNPRGAAVNAPSLQRAIERLALFNSPQTTP